MVWGFGGGGQVAGNELGTSGFLSKHSYTTEPSDWPTQKILIVKPGRRYLVGFLFLFWKLPPKRGYYWAPIALKFALDSLGKETIDRKGEAGVKEFDPSPYSFWPPRCQQHLVSTGEASLIALHCTGKDHILYRNSSVSSSTRHSRGFMTQVKLRFVCKWEIFTTSLWSLKGMFGSSCLQLVSLLSDVPQASLWGFK